jgi:hypothetical protein
MVRPRKNGATHPGRTRPPVSDPRSRWPLITPSSSPGAAGDPHFDVERSPPTVRTSRTSGSSPAPRPRARLQAASSPARMAKRTAPPSPTRRTWRSAGCRPRPSTAASPPCRRPARTFPPVPRKQNQNDPRAKNQNGRVKNAANAVNDGKRRGAVAPPDRRREQRRNQAPT